MGQLPGPKAEASVPFVQPGWHYSVVCPEGYDFVQPWCRLRGVTEDGPRDHIPPGDVGSLMLGAREMAISAREMAYRAAAGADLTAAKAEMAMVSAGLALLLAFMALVSTFLKRRPR